MKIGFDLRPFLSGETGVGVYMKNLLFAMAKIERNDKFFLFSSSFKERFPKEKIPKFKNMKFRDMRIPVSMLNFFWFRLSFPPLGSFFGEKLDITHSPGPMILPGGKKKIITVHDLSFIDEPDLVMPEAVKYYSGKIGRSIEKADAVIAVSEFTRSRIGEVFGKNAYDKTTVIYHGSGLEGMKEKKTSFKIPEKYFLFTGTIEPRKNLTTFIKAFSLSKKNLNGVKIVLAGREGTHTAEVKDLISKLDLDNEIIITGYLSGEELKYLYSRAIALVFPSRYEGFGLPILEAAASGVPSIVSDLEVFREIYKDYPVYFDKDDPKELSDTLIRFCKDNELQKRKKKKAIETVKDLVWEKAAEQTLKLYNKINK